ncbi:MAG: hypothetical protein IPM98_14725 [Lewinellaceae bacterium]|nr:hypothetical protein [Lewinellaceae bacterium]
MKKTVFSVFLLLASALMQPAFAQQDNSKKGKCFTFTNNTAQAANDLHFDLSVASKPVNLVQDPVTGVRKVGGVFENYPSEKKSAQDYKTGGNVAIGGSVTIQFDDETEVKNWYWTIDGKEIPKERGATDGGKMQGNSPSITTISYQPPGGDGALVFTATGMGETTGPIAQVSIYNPTNTPMATVLGPCYITSDEVHQSYIVPGTTAIVVQPNSTANVTLSGYCADIFSPATPKGRAMPPVRNWVHLSGDASLPADWVPATGRGWTPAPNSMVRIPGTDTPMGHTINANKFPEEAAPVLLEAINRITQAYDSLQSRGAITTPIGANIPQERATVAQHTFWMFSAALTGSAYKVDHFAENMEKQYKSATGNDLDKQPDDVQQEIQGGVAALWNTFQMTGAAAKVVHAQPDYSKP